MIAAPVHHSPQELARLGGEIFESKIKPLLKQEDDGKFVAIAIDNGDHEIDEDDYTAIARLRARNPASEFWLVRAGRKTAYRFG